MLLNLRYYGDPILRKKASPIEVITDEIKKLAADMIETVDTMDQLGLAAPQVGHLIRLFVVRNYIELENGGLTLSSPMVYINPKIASYSKNLSRDMEGCLSIPGVRGPVERPESIVIEAQDIHGNWFKEELHGYNARSRMHENDHLNGVLYIDRMHSYDRNKMEGHLQKLIKQYKEKTS